MDSLSSLLADPEVEAVVVDDGSETPADLHLSAVRFFHQPHLGAAAARNFGISKASGRYLWFVDADDTILSSHAHRLVHTLRQLTPSTQLLYTGHMLHPSVKPSPAANHASPHADYQSPFAIPNCLDHTTLVISRQFLADTRYPEDMHLLEDSLFVLLLLQRATSISYATHLHPYVVHPADGSCTAGAWSPARCTLLVPNICHFFLQFRLFTNNHPEACYRYRRYRYVYLRTLAVKGCPWALLKSFRQSVAPLSRPINPLDAFLFVPVFHRFAAFLCRHLRHAK